jgi:hypothetical protein
MRDRERANLFCARGIREAAHQDVASHSSNVAPVALGAIVALLVLVLAACGDTAPTSRKGTAPARIVWDANGPRLEGKGVVRAPPAKNFIERRRFLVKGRREPDGSCSYQREVELTEGQSVTETMNEYDPAACTYVFAEGDYTGPDPAAVAPGESSAVEPMSPVRDQPPE